MKVTGLAASFSFLWPNALAATFYNGGQSQILWNGMSTACDAAWNTSISCPANVIQWVTWPVQSVSWNTSTLDQLCASACSDSLTTLFDAVNSQCQNQQFNMGGQNMTFANLTSFVSYKYGMICMVEDETNEYCADVEESWNITTLVAQNRATWPQHTKKCYMDAENFHWEYLTDGEGNCTDPFENIWPNASEVIKPGQKAAMDYYMEVPDPIDDDNYGWPYPLEYDEYPLEMQCSSCFQKMFEYGHSSIWGDPWDEVKEQIWSNMKLNCGLEKAIVAANNMSGTLE
ncbi:hypothetical protein NX059_001883 [Plenodomus lindquistii]|nr:hypothetical protein NX059_001883 [Plenodomus lindquistii]